MRIKDEIFCFAHLRWCHNGWASNILIVVNAQTPLWHHRRWAKQKNLIFYSLISCQLTLSEVNPTQITLLTHFCCWWWCFHATYISSLDAWCFVVVQGDHIKYIVVTSMVVITVYFEVYCMFKSSKAMKHQFKITIWVLTPFWPLLGGQNCPVKTRF